jgi:hypothetical protein
VTEEFRAAPLLKKREEEDSGIFRGMTLLSLSQFSIKTSSLEDIASL